MDLVLSDNIPAIHGPVVPGEAVKARKELEKFIKIANSSMFDIGELCWRIKKNKYHDGTFAEFLKSLKFKKRRLEYLTKMAECMEVIGIPRTQYEPLGIAKLREITSLDPYGTWINPESKEETPMSAFIQGFVEKGNEMEFTEIQQHVRTLKGQVGEEAMSWLHIYAKQLALDNVIRPALDKMKAEIGSVGKDDEGYGIDASDGVAIEKICVSYLLEPMEGYEVPVEPTVDSA
jgi:hypothetical protein